MTDSMHNTIRYQLWRQDDNGNEFLIQESDSKLKVEREKARLEAGGHKQIYWIRQIASAIGGEKKYPGQEGE